MNLHVKLIHLITPYDLQLCHFRLLFDLLYNKDNLSTLEF